jgi:hypothetical protein
MYKYAFEWYLPPVATLNIVNENKLAGSPLRQVYVEFFAQTESGLDCKIFSDDATELLYVLHGEDSNSLDTGCD